MLDKLNERKIYISYVDEKTKIARKLYLFVKTFKYFIYV